MISCMEVNNSRASGRLPLLAEPLGIELERVRVKVGIGVEAVDWNVDAVLSVQDDVGSGNLVDVKNIFTN